MAWNLIRSLEAFYEVTIVLATIAHATYVWWIFVQISTNFKLLIASGPEVPYKIVGIM